MMYELEETFLAIRAICDPEISPLRNPTNPKIRDKKKPICRNSGPNDCLLYE
jgi:hypothetical protein